MHLLAERRSPLDVAMSLIEGLSDPAVARDVFRRGYAACRTDRDHRVIQARNLFRWLNEPEGVAFTVATLLRYRGGRPPFHGDPKRAARWLTEKATGDELREFVRRRNLCSGLDLVTQMDWPRGGRGGKYIPWRRIFHSLAEAGYTRLRSLTLYQVRNLCAEDDELGGVKQGVAPEGGFTSAAHARQWAGSQAQERQARLAAEVEREVAELWPEAGGAA
jgi:hypothetical protein